MLQIDLKSDFASLKALSLHRCISREGDSDQLPAWTRIKQAWTGVGKLGLGSGEPALELGRLRLGLGIKISLMCN